MSATLPAGQPSVTLNDGTVIPQFGFGVWGLAQDETYEAVRHAIRTGYRRIDTAAIYQNEEETGAAIRDAIAEGDVTREELIVSTKVWNTDQGFDATLAAFETSMNKLGLDYVDIYFIHWPTPAKGLYNDTYRAMKQIHETGRIKTLAVCNFYAEHLDSLIDANSVVPAINQIEIHPGFSQAEQRTDDTRRGIITESWSPLGKSLFFDHPVVAGLAEKYGKTSAQIVLRWHLELGLSVLTRSKNPARIEENFGAVSFTMDPEDVAAITALDGEGNRLGPDPAVFEG